MQIGPAARRSGNIEDRRGQYMSEEDQRAFLDAYWRPARYEKWAEDEWAQHVWDAVPADPNEAGWRRAILNRQARLAAPGERSAGYGAPPSIDLFPRNALRPATPANALTRRR